MRYRMWASNCSLVPWVIWTHSWDHLPILSCKCILAHHKLSSSGGMTRAIKSPKCSPGTETSVTDPSSSSSSMSKSQGGFSSALSSEVWAVLVIWKTIFCLRALQHRGLLGRYGHCGIGRHAGVHILFLFFLYHDIWVMLGKSIINHQNITGSPSLRPQQGCIRVRAATKPGLLLGDWTSLLFLLNHMIMPWHQGVSTSHCLLESGLWGVHLWDFGVLWCFILWGLRWSG